MANIKYIVIKTFIKEVDKNVLYEVIQLSALETGDFDIDIFHVRHDPEDRPYDWYCGNEPEDTETFNHYFLANEHLRRIAAGFQETLIHDPEYAVSEAERLDDEESIDSQIEDAKIHDEKVRKAKQSEYDKVIKFEATCKKTGDRMIFTTDTEEKALSLAEMYFAGEVLKIERVTKGVLVDVRDLYWGEYTSS